MADGKVTPWMEHIASINQRIMREHTSKGCVVYRYVHFMSSIDKNRGSVELWCRTCGFYITDYRWNPFSKEVRLYESGHG
jgi:hypothetical protein